MFGNILVAVDGSDHSFKAVESAAVIGEKFNSKVTLMYVVVLPLNSSGLAPEIGAIPQQVIDDSEKEGQEVLQKAAKIFTGNEIKTVLASGNPSAEILKEAEKGYDLIIVGSRGLGEIRGLLMGSVSSRITHYAKCHVLVVH